MPREESNITVPGPAEILRASQKDELFIKKLVEDVTELAQMILGQRSWIRWKGWTDYYVPTSLYYLLTNLVGNQTLGEEYAGILQVDSSYHRIPSRKRIAVMVLLQVFGYPALDYLLTKMGNFIEKKQELVSNARNSRSEPYLNWNLCCLCLSSTRKLIQFIQKALPTVSQFHLALFFFQQIFYDFSKRITNIRYILLRKYFANMNPASQRNLRYLMWMSLVNLFLTLLQNMVKLLKIQQGDRSVGVSVKKEVNLEKVEQSKNQDSLLKKCSLCLEVRMQPSVTPCGHLFCWHCIIEWLSTTKQECPICREQVLPSQVIPLQNY